MRVYDDNHNPEYEYEHGANHDDEHDEHAHVHYLYSSVLHQPPDRWAKDRGLDLAIHKHH